MKAWNNERIIIIGGVLKASTYHMYIVYILSKVNYLC